MMLYESKLQKNSSLILLFYLFTFFNCQSNLHNLNNVEHIHSTNTTNYEHQKPITLEHKLNITPITKSIEQLKQINQLNILHSDTHIKKSHKGHKHNKTKKIKKAQYGIKEDRQNVTDFSTTLNDKDSSGSLDDLPEYIDNNDNNRVLVNPDDTMITFKNFDM